MESNQHTFLFLNSRHFCACSDSARAQLSASGPVVTIVRGFTGLETPNELHNRGALTDAHAHAALIILIVVKRDQYSLLSRQLK